MAIMNRAQRRSLERNMRRRADPALAASRPRSIVLRGGPMDGWVVKPKAPALHPDWHTTWNTKVAPSLSGWEPGRYVLDDAGTEARWQGLDSTS